MEIKLHSYHEVEIIESERGYDQKIDAVKYFDSKEDAMCFCAEFNAQNTSKTIPVRYAEYVGKFGH
jgi:hypothetical protein